MGTDLPHDAIVTFGGVGAEVSYSSPNLIKCTTPPCTTSTAGRGKCEVGIRCSGASGSGVVCDFTFGYIEEKGERDVNLLR